jgi:hypothetical protein
MKKLLTLSLSLITVLFIAPSIAFATIGVSNNTGKIVLDKPVVPGAVYDIPNIQIKNTGTEASGFGVSVEYNQVQDELKPDSKWLVFSPSTFNLEPGESKIVKVHLELPASAKPGNYFAYIEGHSLKKDGTTGTSIAGAASTKFYFSIAKSSLFMTSYYSVLTFVHKNSAISYSILGILALGLIYLIIKRVNAILKHINSQNLN